MSRLVTLYDALNEVDHLRAAAGELLTAAFILRDQPGEEWAQERFRSCAATLAAVLPNPDGPGEPTVDGAA